MKDRSCAVAAVLRVIVPVLSLVAVSSEDPPPALTWLVRLKGESMAAYAQREATFKKREQVRICFDHSTSVRRK